MPDKMSLVAQAFQPVQAQAIIMADIGHPPGMKIPYPLFKGGF